MDAKDTWVVVKFLIEATGLKRKDARRLLQEVPRDKYSQLFINARAWDRDASGQASKALITILGDEQLATLVEATHKARYAAGAPADEDDEPKVRRRKKK